MGVKVLMEVHLWGIQKDFMKDVTSEGVGSFLVAVTK